MSCSFIHKENAVNELLKKSLVPVPCQECRLNGKDCTNSETIEWLLDLKQQIPIWSRLQEINSSGFKRKLPMSLTKNFDVEIKGRLWSLWGHEVQHKKTVHHSKTYIAATLMALCASRVINLNNWNSSLMDSIRYNGRLYYKTSLKESKCSRQDFKLENLGTHCTFEGINFKICLKRHQQGHLYSTPLKCQSNLAYALIKFFDNYQYGLLECCNRILGFASLPGPTTGYFMYDAQSSSFPLFPNNVSAPYVLRTNHLQVLLYCLIVALNVKQVCAPFCIYCLEILIIEPNNNKSDKDSENSNTSLHLQTPRPSLINLKLISELAERTSEEELNQFRSLLYASTTPVEVNVIKRKYRRKFYNIEKEEEDKSIIKHLIDADRKNGEDLLITKDFVRMICSDTILPLTSAELPTKPIRDFSFNLLEALAMGPEACMKFNELHNN